MSPVTEILIGIVVLVGLFGVVVQVLPGGLLVLGAVVVWGVLTGGVAGWTVAVVALVATGLAAVGKYLLAGRHLQRAGVPKATLVWGGIAGIAGFFAIPVVGLPVGFVAGTYVAERVRLGAHAPAWKSTVAALQATGLTILVELAGALVSAAAWVVGLIVT